MAQSFILPQLWTTCYSICAGSPALLHPLYCPDVDDVFHAWLQTHQGSGFLVLSHRHLFRVSINGGVGHHISFYGSLRTIPRDGGSVFCYLVGYQISWAINICERKKKDLLGWWFRQDFHRSSEVVLPGSAPSNLVPESEKAA